MESKRISRFLSVVLVVALLIQMLPMQAFAIQNDNAESTEQVESTAPVTIVGEEISLRGEAEKHFRLSDGSYLAVTYGTPVHYQDNAGDWQDIDNRPIMATSVDGVASYQISNADKSTSFSSALTDGALFSTSAGEYSVSMHLLDTVQAAEQYSTAHMTADSAASLNMSASEEEFQVFSRNVVAEVEENVELYTTDEEQAGWKVSDLMPEHLSSSIIYEDVFRGVDLRYEASGYNIKEEIIIYQPQDSYRYDFLLTMDGLTAQLKEDGSVHLLNEDDTVIYEIPAPYMYDGAGEYSDAVTYALLEVENGAILTVVADGDWISDTSREFPVTIDPTLNLVVYTSNNGKDESMYMTFVEENDPDATAQGTQELYIGYGKNTKELRGYIYVNKMPELPTGAFVTQATLNLYMGTYSTSSLFEMPLGIYEVTSEPSADQSYQDWIKYMTWNTKADYDSENLIDYVTASENTLYYTKNYGPMSWDMTELVKKWYNENEQNRTVTLGTTTQYSSSKCAACVFWAYHASYAPTLVVSYRNNTGIEPYYTYTTLGAGAAGVAYIADGTGQLKIAKQLLGYASSVNPFSLNLVYNSDYFATSNDTEYHPMSDLGLAMSMGSGWRLDCVQKIETEVISGTTYLKYYDGDGTIHYFMKDSSRGSDYYDEDGLGLKIAVADNTYVMSDDNGNTWTFTNHFLTECADANGNELIINYEGNQLTSIVQKNVSSDTNYAGITVATFAYHDDGRLNTVTDAAGNVFTLCYADSENELTAIKQGDNIIAQYAYDGNRVDQMTDAESEYSLVFTYTNAGRIGLFKEQTPDPDDASSMIDGASVAIDYPSYAQTTYRDYGKDRTVNTSDDLLTYYLFDYAGRTVNAYTTDASGNILGASNAVYSGSGSTDKTNNRTMRTASIGVASQQLLTNSSFESDGGWNFGSTRGETNPRTGGYAVSLSQDITSAQIILSATQTYTFSAYIDTSGATGFTGQGIYLKASCGEEVWTGTPVSYQTSADNKWTRISVTFTAQTSGTYTLSICNDGVSGSVYADDVQLEVGEAPSNYNLLENGNFSMGKNGWVSSDTVVVDNGALKITGSPSDATANASQTVQINLPSTETYVLSGWVTANAVPDTLNTASDPAQDTNKQCGLRAAIHYTDSSVEYHYVPFNTDLSTKQFVSCTIVPNPTDADGNPVVNTVSHIVVTCAYETNANIAYFDNISLVREATQTMKYDDEGNLVSVTTSGLNVDINTYEGGNLIQTVTGSQGVFEYDYDDTYTHRLTSVTNRASEDSQDEWITQSMNYDGFGNVVSTTLTGPDGLTMSTSAGYSSDGNLLTSVTDATGAAVSYQYGTANSVMWGLPTAVTAPNETVTTTAYDLFGRVTQTSVDDLATLSYNYDKGSLSSITRTASDKSQTYSFQYDSFGKAKSISVGSRVLAAYEYMAGNGLLTKQTYGNGHEVTFTYDDLGRTKTVTHADGPTLSYAYTGDGQLNSVTETQDSVSTLYLYQYDTLGNLVGSEKHVGGSPVLRTYHSYNADNKLSAQGWQIGSDTFAQTYTYGEWDGSLSTMTFSQSGETLFSMTYGYDSLRRLSTASNGLLTRTYSYTPNGSQTTAQVSSLAYTGPASSFTYGYTYDNMGNIAAYTDSNGTVTYTYDDLGQLTQAVRGDATYAYTYDNAGNILTANGHTYTYGDTNGWADLLTAVDSQEITYDAIGNPTSYYNGTRWAFTWSQGRQLMTAFTSSTTRDVGITYSYDADGLRTGKIVTAETYSTHTHSYTASQVVEPTCTQRGYTLYTCTCGATSKSNYVAALGHDYTNDLGLTVVICQRCGYRNTGATLPVQPIVPPGTGTMSGGETVEPSDSAGAVMTASTADTRTLLSTTVKEYEYIYAGTTLVRMVVTTTVDDETPTVQTLDFGYDASGVPVTVTTGGATYYYITNLQGDVMALVDSTGTTVAEYEYDPYGNVLSATNGTDSTIGDLNPLCYRSYVYDTETKLYYLQSRYYDPEIGRFINADAYASTGQGILGNNMFAYCGNNPASCVDPTGNVWYEVSSDPYSLFDSNYVLMGGGCGSYAAVFAYYYSDDMEDSGCSEEQEDPILGGTLHTRILPWEYSFFDLSNEGITLVDVSASVANVSFEWDFLDLTFTPLALLSVDISAGLNTENGLHASALAYINKSSVSFNVFGFDITAFVYIGAVGGEFAFNPAGELTFGIAPHGYGGGVSISWDD